MANTLRISLANKCQLLFGAAVILIVSAALLVVWFRMEKLVREGEIDHIRRTASLWIQDKIQLVAALPPADDPTTTRQFAGQMTLKLIAKEDFDVVTDRPETQRDHFLARATKIFQTTSEQDQFTAARDGDGQPYFRYARAIRPRDMEAVNFEPQVDTTFLANPLEMVLLIQFRADQVLRKQALNRIYIVVAGLVAMLLAIGTFWFITTRIILSPVRVLRDTAEKIAEGDIDIRSDINTGDEFEQLSNMFNIMVSKLKTKEQELRQSNKSLDLKLGRLAEHNVALFEANKIKGEFLANVSHELRTPLNGIIGFAEVLDESFKADPKTADEKQMRYVANIISSSRSLLDLINDLLDLAKIEAGRIEVHVQPTSVSDTCEGLINLIRPAAEKAGIELVLKIQKDIPIVQTDTGKVQQIVFNFLSNAVKFTPAGGQVMLTASTITLDGAATPSHLKISVTDTGSGIPPKLHERIFEKFFQLDATVTKVHGGTGLGLTISRDLARLLQGEIELDSREDEGATFSLIVPLQLEARSVPLMPDLVG